MVAYSHSDVAVLLIDMQRSFIKNINISERARLIESQLKVIDYCIFKNIPIIHIEYQKQGSTIPEIKKALRNTNAYYIPKCAPDAFSEKGLSRIIRDELNRNTLFLMGVYASECVYSSGWGAKELGFKVVTARDVIADSSDTEYYTLIGRNGSLESFYEQKDMRFYTSYKEFLENIKN